MDKFNRLTLINQFEILKALNPNEGASIILCK